ncbi:hypothetical protein CEUSTIGMA_g8725.t1 [Chlamydomonas eustigma]|uniref:Uncharacterized protein n=1 Tax=Chlamydomonas eustigma TaxID=1157962 RepID=A0A250XDY9_9CHLO|nr:hypothetical protein CEUSTIGMA_g8725.t1 [Chlamydomonas eustigma]|eukprot:GAX81293.1 hypothetical protein CEUSTIGMA_g8725.t1 [Chlamydomonas eustigma]
MSDIYERAKSVFISALDAKSGVQGLRLYFGSISWDCSHDFFRLIETECDKEAGATLALACLEAARISTAAQGSVPGPSVFRKNLLLALLHCTSDVRSALSTVPVLRKELIFLEVRELQMVLTSVVAVMEEGSPVLPHVVDLLPPLSHHLATAFDAALVIQGACRAAWHPEHACTLLSTLRGLPLCSNSIHGIMGSAVNAATKCELPIAEAIMSQMLMYVMLPDTTRLRGTCPAQGEATRLRGTCPAQGEATGISTTSRSTVLSSVVSVLDILAGPGGQHGEDGMPDTLLRTIASRTLLKVVDTMKYDKGLAKAWVENVDNSGSVEGVFHMTLLCCLSHVAHEQLLPTVFCCHKALVDAAYARETEEPESQTGHSETSIGVDLLYEQVIRLSPGGGDAALSGVMDTAWEFMRSLERTSRLQTSRSKNLLGEVGGFAFGHCNSPSLPSEVQNNGFVALGRLVACGIQIRVAERRVARQRNRARKMGGNLGSSMIGGTQICDASLLCLKELKDRYRSLEVAAGHDGRACMLGIRLLCSVFSCHPGMRAELLCCLTKNAVAASACVSGPAVLLLGQLIRLYPSSVMEHLMPLKDLMNMLPSLHCETTQQGLLAAIWPLCCVKLELQGLLVELLRKVVFSRSVQSRLLAVRGFMHIILEQLSSTIRASQRTSLASQLPGNNDYLQQSTQSSCSQSTLSQMTGLSAGSGVSLMSELLGFLRRSLTQQAAVRRELYQGLQKIMVLDPGSSECIAELLVPQLSVLMGKMKGESESGQSLTLASCTVEQEGSVRLAEDLPSLLICIQTLNAQSTAAPTLVPPESDPAEYFGGPCNQDEVEDGSVTRGAIQVLSALYTDFKKLLLSLDLTQLGFQKTADWSLHSIEGARRHLHAATLLGCLEVLLQEEVMEILGSEAGWTDEKEGCIHQLFQLHKSLFEMACSTRGSNAGRPSSSRRALAKTDMSLDPSVDNGAVADEVADEQGLDGHQSDGRPAGVEVKAKQSSSPACQDLVKADERQACLSIPCLIALCQSITFHSGARGSASRLTVDPAFCSFVLRSCLNSIKGISRGGRPDLGKVYLDAFDAHVRDSDSRGASDSSRTGTTGGRLAGILLSTCFSMILCDRNSSALAGASSSGVTTENEHLAASTPTPSSTSRQLPVHISQPPQGGCNSSRLPTRGRKKSLNTNGDCVLMNSTNAAERKLELLAAQCIKQVLEDVGTTQQLSSILEYLPLPSEEGMPVILNNHLRNAHSSQAGSKESFNTALGTRLPNFYALMRYLSLKGSNEALQVILQALALVGRLLSPDMSMTLGMWIHELVCCQQLMPGSVGQEGCAKAAIESCFSLKGAPEDLVWLSHVAEDVQKVVGATGQDTQTQVEALPLVQAAFAQQLAGTILLLLQRVLKPLDKLFSSMKPKSQMTAGVSLQGQIEESTYERLDKVVAIAALIVNTRLGLPSVLDLQTETVTLIYKLLISVAKYSAMLMSAGNVKGGSSGSTSSLPRALVAVVSRVNQSLTPPVYSCILETQAVTAEELQNTRKATARIKKEKKSIPLLIFQVESWEKHVLTLSKYSGDNLFKGAKRSTNRDFQIKVRSDEGNDAVVVEPAAVLQASGPPRCPAVLGAADCTSISAVKRKLHADGSVPSGQKMVNPNLDSGIKRAAFDHDHGQKDLRLLHNLKRDPLCSIQPAGLGAGQGSMAVQHGTTDGT